MFWGFVGLGEVSTNLGKFVPLISPTMRAKLLYEDASCDFNSTICVCVLSVVCVCVCVDVYLCVCVSLFSTWKKITPDRRLL